MNLKIGIVGLPNVGKSTLFNALTKSAKAEAANFPFCTIEPNVGLVNVPDQRLKKIESLVQPEKLIHSSVEFVDIAGLVEGASKGEGLGNKFLSHIRECNAIAHVLRDFENGDIHHVSGQIDPGQDFRVILTELILADLESIERQLERVSRKAKTGDKEAKIDMELMERFKTALQAEKLANTVELNEEEALRARQFQLLTNKKFLIVANTSEDKFADFDTAAFAAKVNAPEGVPVVPICAQVEAELAELSDEDAQEFLESIGAQQSGLENLIQASFKLLGLQSYFTAGPKEVRAWTIRIGDTAPQAAGAIHTDFEKGFIKADVISYEDFVATGSEAAAKDAGKMRLEGKGYIVQDGDVMHFKFNN